MFIKNHFLNDIKKNLILKSMKTWKNIKKEQQWKKKVELCSMFHKRKTMNIWVEWFNYVWLLFQKNLLEIVGNINWQWNTKILKKIEWLKWWFRIDFYFDFDFFTWMLNIQKHVHFKHLGFCPFDFFRKITQNKKFTLKIFVL